MNGSLTHNQHELQASKNFIWLSISQIIVRIVGLFFYLFLAYKLQDSGLGVYNFISSFVPLWFLFIDFGAGDFLYREWTKHKQSEIEIQYNFNILFTSRLMMSGIIMAFFLVLNWFINNDIILPLIISFFSIFLSMLVHLYDLYLQSKNLFKYTGIRQIIEKTIVIIIGIPLLFLDKNVTYVFLAILISQIISLLYYYNKIATFKVKIIYNFQRTKELFRHGLPFMFIIFLSSIYSRIDMVMLRYFDNFETVGWYGAAYKFLDVSSIFTVLLMVSIFPIASNLYHNKNFEEYIKIFNKIFRIIFSFGLIIVLFFILSAPYLINLFFPESFNPAILALRILMIAQGFVFLSIFFSNILLIQNKEKKGLKIIFISTIFNIVLNILLIPKYSLYGAAWATAIAELLNLIMLQYSTTWEKNYNLLIKMLTISIIDSLFLLTMKLFGQLNNIYFSTIIIFINICIAFYLKLINIDDIKLLIEPIKNKFKNRKYEIY